MAVSDEYPLHDGLSKSVGTPEAGLNLSVDFAYEREAAVDLADDSELLGQRRHWQSNLANAILSDVAHGFLIAGGQALDL